MNPFRTRLAALLTAALLGGGIAEGQVTKIIDNGPDDGRKVIAVFGDGYALNDQQRFNNDVQRMIVDGVFKRDFFAETHNAFNVYRVNLVSLVSGVSQRQWNEMGTPNDPADDVVASQTILHTPLRYIYNGSWAHCWIRPAKGATDRLLRRARERYVPNADFVVVILNENGGGGCGGAGLAIVTRGESWSTVAHELGHGAGGLADEYTRPQAYTGSAVNGPNISTTVSRTGVAWARFIHPSTPIPTTFQSSMDPNRTVGMFKGAAYSNAGIYRPTQSSRMRGNTPDFGPVGHAHMRKQLHAATGQDFGRIIVGDFNGDGRDDAMVHNDQDFGIYYASTTTGSLERAWFANNEVPAGSGSTSWKPGRWDQYVVADFDKDGRDDLYVFNGRDWPTPFLGMLRSTTNGFECVARYDTVVSSFWTMKSGDILRKGDFDGDGLVDLALFNGTQWNQPYLAIFRSTGIALVGVKRYDGAAAAMGGWTLKPNDRITVADFDADGRDDLYMFNGLDWTSRYLGMMRSTTSGIVGVKLYTNTLPGWQMAKNDELLAADFNRDGRKDLYITNRYDWGPMYLMMLRSTGAALAAVRQYSSNPGQSPTGWSLQKGDGFKVCDLNGDGREDLFVHNTSNGPPYRIGSLRSGITYLVGNYVSSTVGTLTLARSDIVLPAGYDGTGAANGVFVHTPARLGLCRHKSTAGSSRLELDRFYHQWIDPSVYDSRPTDNATP